LRVGLCPVGALYIAAMLLTNFKNCVYPILLHNTSLVSL
jgi:hypothetical protein